MKKRKLLTMEQVKKLTAKKQAVNLAMARKLKRG